MARAQRIPENDIKIYVDVKADHKCDGRIIPLSIVWNEDGNSIEYKIDRLLDVSEAVPEKAGGHGTRYRIRIGHNETYLFHETASQLWFVERRH